MKILEATNKYVELIKKADADEETAKALIKLIANTAMEVGVAEHSYIVGGSVRDYVMGVNPKDIDIVVETRKDPDTGETKNAVTLAEAVAKKLNVKGVKADQYGVVHIGPVPNDIFFDGVNMKGQKIEIVTARKEKYDKGLARDSHKPTAVAPGTIHDDLSRRDFTFNTLTWRLSDLTDTIDKAPVLDILGNGLNDLREKRVTTPLDPVETFTEDPSRMLRAVRFAVKYNFEMTPETRQAIRENANEIKRMPWEPIADVFVNKILKLGKNKAVVAIQELDNLNLLKPTLEMIDKMYLQRQLKDLPIGNDAGFIMFLLGYIEKYNIQNFIYKFPRQFTNELKVLFDKLSSEDFQNLYNRLQTNIISTDRVISELGLTGQAIGKAVSMARSILLSNPNLSNKEIEDVVVERFSSDI